MTRVDRTCRVCGKAYTVTQYYVRNGWGKACSVSCTKERPLGSKRDQRRGGYVEIKAAVGKDGWKLEHRLVMEQHLGRELYPHENVHHLNGIRGDNRLENLELWSSAQPSGQRVDDKIAWAIEFLNQYGYEVSGAHQATLEIGVA